MELRNVARLNIFHRNSNRLMRGLQPNSSPTRPCRRLSQLETDMAVLHFRPDLSLVKVEIAGGVRYLLMPYRELTIFPTSLAMDCIYKDHSRFGESLSSNRCSL